MSRILAKTLSRTVSRRCCAANNSIINTTSTSTPMMNSMKKPTLLRQSIRRNMTKDIQCAALNEVNSLRLVSIFKGPETSLNRGWDSGIDDDDGG